MSTNVLTLFKASSPERQPSVQDAKYWNNVPYLYSKPLTVYSWLWYALMHFLQFLQPIKKGKIDRWLILRETLPLRVTVCNGSRNCVCLQPLTIFFFSSKLKWRSLHRREHFSAYLWRRFTKLILTCWWYVYLQLFFLFDWWFSLSFSFLFHLRDFFFSN